MFLCYARCSTDDQAKGTTIDEQIRRLRALAASRGFDEYDIVIYKDEDVSGSISLAHRPDGSRLLADAKPGDFIAALKIDRMFRNVLDALTVAKNLKEQKIDLAFGDFMGAEPITGDGLAQCFFTVATAFAQLERDKINERTSDGRRAKKAKGGCVGSVPYGFAKNGEGRASMLVPDAGEQATIKLAKELAALTPRRTPSWIANELFRQGRITRSGKKFQAVQVDRIIRVRH